MNQKILLVEDDANLRKALTIALQASGYDVVTAEDGKGAVLRAWTEKPALVVLDLGLPGLDGFTVLDDFNTLPGLCNTPVVVLSGHEPSVAEPRVRQHGISAYLRKPVTTDVLRATIAEALATGSR